MAAFPCSSEDTAASALLLLTVTPPPPPPKGCLDDGDESSVVRSELGKSEGTNSRNQSFVSGHSSFPEFQALQKNRSKIQGGVKFNSWKTCSGVKVAMTKSFAVSTSSRPSSGGSSSRSSYCNPKAGSSRTKLASVVELEHPKKIRKKKKQQQQEVGSAILRRKAEAILELLSQGCYSEVKIRQTLGDSPDTSKALRLLLKSEEVKRTGAGGRRSPYIYTIA